VATEDALTTTSEPDELAEEDVLGFLATGSGRTYTLAGAQQSSGGVIFTRHDMPTLEDLLEQHNVVFAVLERPAPQVTLQQRADRRDEVPGDVLRAEDEPADIFSAIEDEAPSVTDSAEAFTVTRNGVRIATAASIAATVLAVGVTLLVSFVAEGIRAGGEAAITLTAVGLGLCITVVVALLTPSSERDGG
jgi:hypothetical protein